MKDKPLDENGNLPVVDEKPAENNGLQSNENDLSSGKFQKNLKLIYLIVYVILFLFD